MLYLMPRKQYIYIDKLVEQTKLSAEYDDKFGASGQSK